MKNYLPSKENLYEVKLALSNMGNLLSISIVLMCCQVKSDLQWRVEAMPTWEIGHFFQAIPVMKNRGLTDRCVGLSWCWLKMTPEILIRIFAELLHKAITKNVQYIWMFT